MEVYFQGNEYHTPEDQKRFFLDYLFLNTRVYLMLRFIGQGFASRKKVLEGTYDRAAWAAASYDIFKSVEGCGGKFHLTGLDNLKEIKGPVVFVANHMSTLEAVILPSIIAPLMDMTFVIKDSLMKVPIFKDVFASRNPIVVGRENPREDLQRVLTEGLALLEAGTSVTIFPQSTRRKVFAPEEFNSLGVKLAKKGNVPVVPIALKTDFWENGKIMKDLGPIYRDREIYFAFGKPIEIEGTGKEAHRQCIEFISENLKEWGAYEG